MNETGGVLEPAGASQQARDFLAPSGVLKAAINLGNPVLAQGTADDPRGITVQIARQLAAWLGVPLSMVPVPAARESYAAICQGQADLCFLANEPARAEGVCFTDPYVVIEGVYLVRDDSALGQASEVDAPGVSIGVRTGSAYDLFLSRSLQHATIVRGDEATEVFQTQELPVCAGIRQPQAEYAQQHGHRILEPAFMQILQAVGVRRDAPRDVVGELDAQLAELKSSGFIARQLKASGVQAVVAP